MLDGVHKALFGVRREFAQIGDDVAGIDHAKPVAMRAMLRIKRFTALRLLGTESGVLGWFRHLVGSGGRSGDQGERQGGQSSPAGTRHVRCSANTQSEPPAGTFFKRSSPEKIE